MSRSWTVTGALFPEHTRTMRGKADRPSLTPLEIHEQSVDAYGAVRRRTAAAVSLTVTQQNGMSTRQVCFVGNSGSVLSSAGGSPSALRPVPCRTVQNALVVDEGFARFILHEFDQGNIGTGGLCGAEYGCDQRSCM